MYILKFFHFSSPSRPKRISDTAYSLLTPSEAEHYRHEEDETDYYSANLIAADNRVSVSELFPPSIEFTQISDSSFDTPSNDQPQFDGFGGGDFGGGGSSASWDDNGSSNSTDSSPSFDSGSSYDSGSSTDSSSYDSGSSSSDSSW